MDIFEKITKLVNTRPGFAARHYDNASSYRADCRVAAKDRETALALLNNWYFRSYVTAERLEKYLAENTGRLTLKNGEIDYCDGQYYPTEYRRAVVCALSSCLWLAVRDSHFARRGTFDGGRDYVDESMRCNLPSWLYKRIK